MEAMTISYRVANVAEMHDLRPGDSVTFELDVDESDARIEHVAKRVSTASWPFPVKWVTTATELKAGDLCPDARLTKEKGETTYFHDFRGRVLAISIIHLGCPLPNYCPLMNRNFQTAQTLIQRLGCDQRVRLLSLTMDAAHDTPQRVAAVASGYEAKPPLWTFASVAADQLRPLTNAADLQFSETNGQIVHNLRTVVLDSEERITHIFRGNNWTPQELVAELRLAMAETHPESR